MINHPSRYYIYYLFSKRSMDAPTIIQCLADLRLPVPQDEKELERFIKELLEARRKMKIPARFKPLERPFNEETRDFLKKWRIEGMWTNDQFVARASDILNEPPIRRMVETLILGPLNVRDIAYRVRTRFGLPERVINTRVIHQYMHYYWNDGLLDTEQWKTLVFRWMPGRNNDLMTALMSPRSAAGAAMTISAADRGGGQSVNSVVMYSAIRDQGFRMFMDHCLHDKPGINRTQGAMFALNIITAAEEELDKRRGGSAELIEELHKIQTVYDDSKLKTVHELPQVRDSLPAVIDAEGEDVTEEEADE
jgi:hypothetical protein